MTFNGFQSRSVRRIYVDHQETCQNMIGVYNEVLHDTSIFITHSQHILYSCICICICFRFLKDSSESDSFSDSFHVEVSLSSKKIMQDYATGGLYNRNICCSVVVIWLLLYRFRDLIFL